jgi:hypothetical protein
MSSSRNPNVTSRKAKVGYFFLGLFLAAIGVLIAWLLNKGRPSATTAVKFSTLGFIAAFVISFATVFILFFLPIIVDASL